MDQELKDRFLSFYEALDLFAGSESTLRRRIGDGSIPVRQLGGKGCLIEISYSALMEENQRRIQIDPRLTKPEGSTQNDDDIPGPKPKWRK